MESWHPGEAVLIARKRDKLTQAELAEQVGLSQAQLSRIENGTSITWEQILMFAEVQGRDLEWYVYGPSNTQRGNGGVSQRSHHLVGVNGLSLSNNTKTDAEAAAIWFHPRRSHSWFPMAQDVEEKPVTVVETPHLFEDVVVDLGDDAEVDRWLELFISDEPRTERLTG